MAKWNAAPHPGCFDFFFRPQLERHSKSRSTYLTSLRLICQWTPTQQRCPSVKLPMESKEASRWVNFYARHHLSTPYHHSSRLFRIPLIPETYIFSGGEKTFNDGTGIGLKTVCLSAAFERKILKFIQGQIHPATARLLKSINANGDKPFPHGDSSFSLPISTGI
ncbi:hypothetical protein CC2G_007306 [Coprinopsis cinerea AmutBmut pab1-1]|nr:hypothetical protein CC2G_007306 [Coprinopsis cinerea AmutBmut pab1-1]